LHFYTLSSQASTAALAVKTQHKMAQRMWTQIQETMEYIVTGDRSNLERWFGNPDVKNSTSPLVSPPSATKMHPRI
jgi:hypothetical protein